VSPWGEIVLELPRGYRGGASRGASQEERGGARGKQGGAGSATQAVWGAGAGGRAQRLRAASGARQAVVKVIGYRRGRGEAGRTLDYVGRRERIDLETSTGERLSTQDELRSLLDEWSTTFSERSDGRDVMHLMLSFPEDVSPEKAREIAVATLPEIAGGRDWVLAVHDDTGHAHVHALVRMRGPDGRQLRTTRDTLQRWREATAREARERGVTLEASPRWARGRGEKGERAWERGMRLRGETPQRHRDAAREALGTVNETGSAEGRFERLMTATNAREKGELAALSWTLLTQGRDATGEDRARLLRLADAAARHGEALPEARTRRQALAAIAEEMRAKGREPDVDALAAELGLRRGEAERSREPPLREARVRDRSDARERKPAPPQTPQARNERDIEARHQDWLARRAERRERDRDPGRDPDD